MLYFKPHPTNPPTDDDVKWRRLVYASDPATVSRLVSDGPMVGECAEIRDDGTIGVMLVENSELGKMCDYRKRLEALPAALRDYFLYGSWEATIDVARATPIREAASEINIYAVQDDCLVAIQDRRPIPDAILRQLPPWRAVMIARIGAQAGVRMEKGSLAELKEEAARVGGAGKLAATYEEARRNA